MRPSIPRSAARVLALAALLVAAGAADAAAQRGGAYEWTTAGRLHAYVHDLFGPGALVGLAAATTVDQLRTDPEAWGDDADGFGRRLASNAGRLFVQETTRHALAIALGRSTRYQPCDCHGFGPRVGHALVESFTDRGRSGDRLPAIPRFAGAFAGAYAQRAWRPDMSAGEAAVDGATAILFGAVSNVARELIGWPH